MSEPLKSSDHRLAGVLGKYHRSSEHFDQFCVEMNAFFNEHPQPHSSIGEFDPETREWVERFKISDEPPGRFGVILGDVVHNLRSALDHLMWQVTLLDGGTPCDSTQFPIASKSEQQFEDMANYRIPDLSAMHRAIVKKVQPYHAGDEAPRHPLSVLADLSNIDKHRVVHATHSASVGDAKEALDRLVESFQGGPSPVESFWLIKQGQILEDGTPWFRIKFGAGEEPPGEVNMGGHLPLGVAFGDLGVRADEVPLIADLVLSIIQTFQADFPETVFED